MPRGSRRHQESDPKEPLFIRMSSALGLAIEEHRLARGLGINELARLAGISAAQVSRLEGGHQARAHPATIRKLAAALEVDPDSFLRLAEFSRRYPISTATLDNLPAKIVADLQENVTLSIDRDPTIPARWKRWLHECVALARMAK